MAGPNQNSHFERKEPKLKAPPAVDPETGEAQKVRGGGPLVRGYVESDDLSMDNRRCTHESPYTGHRCAAYCVKGARVCAYHGGGTEKWVARIEGRYSDIFGDGASKLRDQYLRFLNDPDICDVRDEVALSRTLLASVLTKVASKGGDLTSLSPEAIGTINVLVKSVTEAVEVCDRMQMRGMFAVNMFQLDWIVDQVITAVTAVLWDLENRDARVAAFCDRLYALIQPTGTAYQLPNGETGYRAFEDERQRIGLDDAASVGISAEFEAEREAAGINNRATRPVRAGSTGGKVNAVPARHGSNEPQVIRGAELRRERIAEMAKELAAGESARARAERERIEAKQAAAKQRDAKAKSQAQGE